MRASKNKLFSRYWGRHHRGVTAMELLVVVAVMAIIGMVALPQFSKIRERQVSKNATIDVVSALSKARSQTLASVNSSTYGVRFESDRVIIFTGESFSDEAAGNEIVSIISPAEISSIDLVGGASELYFRRLNGTPSATGSVTVSTPNYSQTITISATGVISAQ